MIRKLAFTIAVALAISGCGAFNAVQTAATGSPSQTVINQARTTVLGLDNLYGVAVIAADTWAQPGNRCGAALAPQPPICSTPQGIIAVNKAAVAMRGALNKSEELVMKASPAQTDLDLAISSANAAWSVYQSVLATYGVKTGS